METNTGVTEDYKAMVEKLEHEKRGIYEDLKSETKKRQTLEEEVKSFRAEVNSRLPASSQPDENLKWITDFATKPKDVLKKEFEEFVKPIRETNQQLSAALVQRDAIEWLAEEEGTTVNKIRKSGVLKDLQRIGEERNLGTMPIMAGTQAAYEFLKLERQRKASEEKERDAAIQGASTQSTGSTAPVTSGTGRVWKESEVSAMDLATFQHHQKDITLARSEGRFVSDLSKANEKGRLELPRN